jgi:uncharacterized membrane protein YoaK (UPF0700 family)
VTRLKARARLFACLLSALAGFVDSIGFIRTGGFFVSFMSGNSTRLGIAIASSIDAAMIAAGIVLAFLAGVVGGSLLGDKAQDRRPPAVLFLVAGLLACSATLKTNVTASVALLAIAMGAENAVFERDGEVRLGVTYMTGSLVRVGNGVAAALLGRPGNAWLGYLLLWLTFVSGAVAGTIAFAHASNWCIWVASATAALLGIASIRLCGPD